MTRRRAPEGFAVLVALDPSASESLSRQIYRALRDGILAGRLSAGLRLPSTRALATDLGVSRNTVVTAFDQLLAEGYVESRVGRGTRVSATMPDHLLHTRARPRLRSAPAAVPSRPSARGEELVEHARPKSAVPGGAVAFAPGVPALELFPWQTWARLIANRARELGPATAGYSDSLGYRPLREAVARYVAVARGVTCTPDQVLIVGGSQQGLDLVARVVTDPGDSAWIEDPGYYGALGAFVAAGLNVTGVPVDADGLSVAAGIVGAPAARLVYVTPSHQFPLGVTMSLSRRLELLAAAAEMQAWIIEDDYDSEFRYVSRPLTALQGLDTDGRVVYVGTFSKVMFPALRIGFVIAPPSLVPALAAARKFSGTQHPMLEQMVLADFIAGGHFERHVRRMRAVYAERQQVLIDALGAECDGLVDASPAGSGMHLVGWLPPGVNDADVARRAAARGVDAIPLSKFTVSRDVGRAGVLLGYAHVDKAAMFAAARGLAAAVRESAQIKGPGTLKLVDSR
ncbi:MAG TPA: PLP-dependent aminotransferase family protein [Gemmatimonadaceae bacterium]|nr:PLP-dependent aminotransferase family protein [Gemmatimonadaceae bacterium]